MESGDLLDFRGAKKAPKLKDEKKEPDKKWMKEAQRIASIKDDDILKKLKINREWGANLGRRCDLCDNPATKFSSPFGNPDEEAYCDKHFKEVFDRKNCYICKDKRMGQYEHRHRTKEEDEKEFKKLKRRLRI